MADEDDFIPYKDISDLKRDLENIKDKKDVSTKELYEAVSKLAAVMEDMLEIFGAAAEQLKLEEKEYESEAKKHDAIISRLDKLTDQNRTIAEGLVAMVDMVRGKFPEKESGFFKPKVDEEPMFVKSEPAFKPKSEQFARQPQWKPAPEPMPVAQMPPMPPMQAEPMPDLDFPEDFLLEEEPKKKGLFGVFKK